MIDVSKKFKEAVKKNSKVSVRIKVILQNGVSEILIDGGHIMSGTLKIEDSVTSNGSFDIGAAIINKMSVTLRNENGFFDGYDLDGATFYPQIGKLRDDGVTEWINKGAFIVDNPTKRGKLIHIEALDQLSKFELEYSEVNTVYPATLRQIVADMALYCGVPVKGGDFPQSTFVVNERPQDSGLTCLQVLAYVAQIAGCFARCDVLGYLEFKWYIEVDPENANHKITKMASHDIKENDIVITGIKVIDTGDTNNESFYGERDYFITIDSNPLIGAGKSGTVAKYLGEKTKGLRFRPLSCTCLSDPTIEAGDSALVTDSSGNNYFCYVNNVTYAVGSYSSIACEAKTASSNRVVPFSNESKAAVIARKEASKKIEVYNKSVQQLTSLMTQSFGVYKTEEVAEDGATIFYMHDRPLLSESTKIWKMTADAFAVSSDGGKTWTAGIDSNGNVVTNVLSAIGVKADWIQTGAFTVIDEYGNSIFNADKDTGQVSTSIKTEKGTLKGFIANHNLNFSYEDANGNVLSGIYFDFEEGVFKFDGAGNFTGSLNIADKFIVDVFGNARIYGGKYYAMDEEGNIENFTSMDKDGFTVYNQNTEPVIKIGYPTGDSGYPYVRLYSEEGSDEQSALVKKFANGLWVGNDAPVKDTGYFYGKPGYSGMFYDFEDKKVYVVNGNDMQNIYTGESIARFG